MSRRSGADHDVAAKIAGALAVEFLGIFSFETVEHFVVESYDALAADVARGGRHFDRQCPLALFHRLYATKRG